MARRVVIYNDFSKGEYGRLGPTNAPKGSWTGENVTLYDDGSLGERAGVHSQTAAAGNFPEFLRGSIPVPRTSFGVLFDGTSTGVVTQELDGDDGPDSTGTGAFDSNIAADASWCRGGPGVIYVNNGVTDNDSYSVTVNSATGEWTIAKLANSPGGSGGIAVYGEQLVVGAPSGDTDAIRASAAGDFGTWPSAALVPIGAPGSPVLAVFTVKNSLIIMKGEGMFQLTGVVGVNESVRRLNNADPPDEDTAFLSGAVTGRDTLWWQSREYPCPVYFDGAYDRRHPHIQTKGSAEVVTVDRERDCILLWYREFDEVGEGEGDTILWMWRNGHWEKHRFYHAMIASPTSTDNDTSHTLVPMDTDTGGFFAGEFPTLVAFFPTDVTDTEQDTFGQWLIGLDRPGFTTDDYAEPLADEMGTVTQEAYFSLPEWYADEGTEIMVRQVNVDFTAWNTGVAATCHFDLKVDAFNVYDGETPVSSATLEYDEPGAEVTAGVAGQRKRRVFSFGDQGLANGFQVHFNNMRQVAIRRVSVVIESQSVRS